MYNNTTWILIGMYNVCIYCLMPVQIMYTVYCFKVDQYTKVDPVCRMYDLFSHQKEIYFLQVIVTQKPIFMIYIRAL